MSRVRNESVGDSVCPVCHENSEIFAIGPCDHPICYRCSTRMRVLCNQVYCPICRGDLPQIVYLTTKQKYEEVERRSCIPNRKYKILLEDESVEDAFEALLEHRCQVCDQRPLFDSFQALQTHMNRTHTLFACDLCASHLKIFPFERKFYNRKDLATHRRNGDPDNRSYRGHPLCRFCDVRYMDNDELLRHLRKSHYYCHFCDANSANNEYFDDYPDLKEHFRVDHFLCEEGQCGSRETRFTNAFATEIDYKAHVAAEHRGNKSKAQARELRTIDVNFQVAPRRRGRDAGVVAPEDFEEVNEANRGPRDRRNRRYNNRHEASSRNENVMPPPEASAPPPAPEPPALDDFPTLGNCLPPYIPPPEKRPDEPVEEFPSLSSNKHLRSATVTTSSLVSVPARPVGKSSASVVSQKPSTSFSAHASVAAASSGASRPGSGGGSRTVQASHPVQAATVTKQSWSAPRLASGEDFPSLGGDRKSKDGPNYVSLGGAWTKKQQQKSSSRPSSSRNDRAPVFSAASLASLGKSLCDDGEFPSLGGGGGGTTSKQAIWVQKNAKPIKKNPEKSTPLGNCLDTSSHSKSKKDDSFNLNGSSESRTDETKSKKKKKKQKEKGQETKTNTEDSGISLSSIASEIEAVTVIPEQEHSKVQEDSSEQKSSQDIPPSNDQTTVAPSPVVNSEREESEEWETVVSKKSVAFDKDDFPSLSTLSKKRNGKLSSAEEFRAENDTTKKSKSVVTKPSNAFQDDFPTLSSLTDKKSVAASPARETTNGKGRRNKTEGTKNSKALLGDEDFPTLQAQTKKAMPPPGFGKTRVTAPPPGLSAHPPSLDGRTPPGLTSNSSISAPTASLATIPMSVKLNMYSYVILLDGKERNSALVSRVRQLLILKDDGFDQFRVMSAEFRSGQMDAVTYHKTCENLFGQEKFLEVLPELIALLPDILKQHELAEAHSKSILGMCAPLNLTTCQTCHQYLKVEDLAVHFGAHTNLGQAPADFTAASLPLKT